MAIEDRDYKDALAKHEAEIRSMERSLSSFGRMQESLVATQKELYSKSTATITNKLDDLKGAFTKSNTQKAATTSSNNDKKIEDSKDENESYFKKLINKIDERFPKLELGGRTKGMENRARKMQESFYKSFKELPGKLSKSISKGIGKIFSPILKTFNAIKDAGIKGILLALVGASFIKFLEGIQKASEWFGNNPSFGEMLASGLSNLIGFFTGASDEERKKMAENIVNFFNEVGDFFKKQAESFKKIKDAEGFFGTLKAMFEEFPVLTGIIGLIAFGAAYKFFRAVRGLFNFFKTSKVPKPDAKNLKTDRTKNTNINKTEKTQTSQQKPKPNIKSYPAGTTIDGKKVGGQTYNANKPAPKGLQMGKVNPIVDAAKNTAKNTATSTVSRSVANSMLRKVGAGALGMLIPGAGWVMTAAMIASLGYDAYTLAKNTETGQSFLSGMKNFYNENIAGPKGQIGKTEDANNGNKITKPDDSLVNAVKKMNENNNAGTNITTPVVTTNNVTNNTLAKSDIKVYTNSAGKGPYSMVPQGGF